MDKCDHCIELNAKVETIIMELLINKQNQDKLYRTIHEFDSEKKRQYTMGYQAGIRLGDMKSNDRAFMYGVLIAVVLYPIVYCLLHNYINPFFSVLTR